MSYCFWKLSVWDTYNYSMYNIYNSCIYKHPKQGIYPPRYVSPVRRVSEHIHQTWWYMRAKDKS